MARALQEQYINIVQGIEDESVISCYDANLKVIAKISTWGVVRVSELTVCRRERNVCIPDHKVIPLANTTSRLPHHSPLDHRTFMAQ